MCSAGAGVNGGFNFKHASYQMAIFPRQANTVIHHLKDPADQRLRPEQLPDLAADLQQETGERECRKVRLARLGWLEHPTYRFEVCRSIHLSYRRTIRVYSNFGNPKSGCIVIRCATEFSRQSTR